MSCQTCQLIAEIESNGFMNQDLYLVAVERLKKLESDGKLKCESRNIESIFVCLECAKKWSFCMPDGPMRGWIRPIPKNQQRMKELREKFNRS